MKVLNVIHKKNTVTANYLIHGVPSHFQAVCLQTPINIPSFQ